MLSSVDFSTDRYKTRKGKLKDLKILFKDHGYTLVQGLLAWIATEDSNAIPIPGAKNLDQATENFGVLELGTLSASLKDEVEYLCKEAIASTFIRS